MPTMVESERVAASGRQVMAAADVLVIDFSLNDVGLKANTSPWSGMGLGNYSTYELVGAATEAVLRFILTTASSSALLMVESNCRVARGDGESGRAHRDVAAHYGVAFVSLCPRYCVADQLRALLPLSQSSGTLIHIPTPPLTQ